MLNAGLVRVLHVDLTTGESGIQDRQDLWRDYLGGTGVACRLLDESVHDNRDPLDASQPIAFANGPLTTIFPVVTKAVATFRSPLTGEYGESHAGGHFASALRYAGYDALLITGAAQRLSYLLIDGDKVEIRPADAMRGIAALTEGDSGGQLTETINATELAAIFRLISEATDNIRNTAAFTHEPAKVRPRVLN